MKEKSELRIGLIIAIGGVLATASFGWAGWVSITLYGQNGSIESLAAKVSDDNQTSHEILNILSGKDTIPLQASMTMSN